MLEAVCPNGHHLQVPLEHAGMKLRCPAPGCGIIFQLSATSPTGVPVNPAPGPTGSGVGIGGGTATAPQPAVHPQPTAPQAPAPQQPAQQPIHNQPVHTQPYSEPQGSRWTGSDQPQQPAAQQAPAASRPMMNVGPRLPMPGAGLLSAAQALLMIGLVAVLSARGCDSLGARNVNRLKAKLELDRQQFDNEFNNNLASLNRELQAEKITDKQRTDVEKRIADLRKSHDAERRVREEDWNEMSNAAAGAASSNVIWGYWREMLFVVGTILLSLGLVAVGLASPGPERYLSFGMLAIIVFSVYVGGVAWFSAMASVIGR